jgi:hypothetical protein
MVNPQTGTPCATFISVFEEDSIPLFVASDGDGKV